MMKYRKFAAMIATSTVVMFGLMYLNTYAWDHVYFSQTRAYMALVMGAAMSVVMLSFMLAMYTSRRINVALFTGSAIVFVGALWLVRTQQTVDDVSWMRAMIPHHSIAKPDQRAGPHPGSPCAQAGRRNHRGAAPRDRRDEGPDHRTRQEIV